MYKKVRLIKLSNGCEIWCPEDTALKIIDAMEKNKKETFELCNNYFKAEDVVSVLTEDFVFLNTKKHFNEKEDLIKNINVKEFYCSYDDYKKSMNGIYTTSINDFTKDEAPMVYKKPEEIIENITDTVEITNIIKPIYNFKANN